MTFTDFIRSIEGQNLEAKEKCERFAHWLAQSENNATYEELREFIERIEGYVENSKKTFVRSKNKLTRDQANIVRREITENWFAKAANKSLSYQQYQELFPEDLTDSTQHWFERSNVTIQDLINAVNIPGLTLEQKELLLLSYYRSSSGNRISEKELILFIQNRFITNATDNFKKNLAQIFFEKNNYQPPQSHSLLIFLVGSEVAAANVIIQNYSFEQLCQVFVENNEFMRNDLQIPERRIEMIRRWLSKPENKLNANQLKQLVEVNPQLNRRQKRQIIYDVINKNSTKEARLECLESLVQNGIFDRFNNYNIIFSLVSQILGKENQDLDLAQKFAQKIYASVDSVKANFLVQFIFDRSKVDRAGRPITFARNCEEQREQILSNFVESIAADDEAMYFVGKAERYFKLNPEQIIKLAKNRTAKQYSSLKQLLGNRQISGSVKETEIRNLIEIFGLGVLDMNLLDIFSYYNIQENVNLSIFRNLLKPEAIVEIEQNFKIDSDLCYLTEEEYNRLKFLIPRLNLPKVGVLSQRLKERIKILTISEGEVNDFKINFDEGFFEIEIPYKEHETKEELVNRQDHNNKTYSLDLRAELSKDFEKLLKKNPAELFQRDEEVLKFFTKLLKKHESYFDDLGEERVKDFCQFIHRNKREIAFMLKQNDGIDVVRNVFFSMQDGCANNITSVFNTALIEYSIRKARDLSHSQVTALRVLYQAYNDDIFTTQINRNTNEGGKYYVGRSANPLDHPGIRACHICFDGFIKKIASKFENFDKKIEYLQDAIFSGESLDKTADERRQEFLNILSSIDGLLEDEDRTNDFIAYVIISQVVPDIYSQRFIQAHKDFRKFQNEIYDKKLLEVVNDLRKPENNFHYQEFFNKMPFFRFASLKMRIDYVETWLTKEENFLIPGNFEFLFNGNEGFIGQEQFEEDDERKATYENPKSYLQSVVARKNQVRLNACKGSSAKYVEVLEAENRGELIGAFAMLNDWMSDPANYFTYQDLDRLFRTGGAFSHFYSSHRLNLIQFNFEKSKKFFSATELCNLFSYPHLLGQIDVLSKYQFVTSWLQEGENNFFHEELQFLLGPDSILSILSPRQKFEIMIKSLDKRENKINSRQIIDLVSPKYFPGYYQNEKSQLLLKWLEKEENIFSEQEEDYLLTSGEVFVPQTLEHSLLKTAINRKKGIVEVPVAAAPDPVAPAPVAAAAAAAADHQIWRQGESSEEEYSDEYDDEDYDDEEELLEAGGEVDAVRAIDNPQENLNILLSRIADLPGKFHTTIRWIDERRELTFSQLFTSLIVGGAFANLDAERKTILITRWLNNQNNNLNDAQMNNLFNAGMHRLSD